VDYVSGRETRFVGHLACKVQPLAMQESQLSRVSPACEGNNEVELKNEHPQSLDFKGLSPLFGLFYDHPFFETVTQSKRVLFFAYDFGRFLRKT
jgi:hypothetical protein